MFIDTQEAADTDAIASISVVVAHTSAHSPIRQLLNVGYIETKTLSNAYLAALVGAEYISVSVIMKDGCYISNTKDANQVMVAYALMSAKDAKHIAGRYWKTKDVRENIKRLLAGVIDRSYS